MLLLTIVIWCLIVVVGLVVWGVEVTLRKHHALVISHRIRILTVQDLRLTVALREIVLGQLGLRILIALSCCLLISFNGSCCPLDFLSCSFLFVLQLLWHYLFFSTLTPIARFRAPSHQPAHTLLDLCINEC